MDYINEITTASSPSIVSLYFLEAVLSVPMTKDEILSLAKVVEAKRKQLLIADQWHKFRSGKIGYV